MPNERLRRGPRQEPGSSPTTLAVAETPETTAQIETAIAEFNQRIFSAMGGHNLSHFEGEFFHPSSRKDHKKRGFDYDEWKARQGIRIGIRPILSGKGTEGYTHVGDGRSGKSISYGRVTSEDNWLDSTELGPFVHFSKYMGLDNFDRTEGAAAIPLAFAVLDEALDHAPNATFTRKDLRKEDDPDGNKVVRNMVNRVFASFGGYRFSRMQGFIKDETGMHGVSVNLEDGNFMELGLPGSKLIVELHDGSGYNRNPRLELPAVNSSPWYGPIATSPIVWFREGDFQTSHSIRKPTPLDSEIEHRVNAFLDRALPLPKFQAA